MTVQEVKTIRIRTMLIWNPTNEPFYVTGYNEIKVSNGTETKVSGIDNFGIPSLYSLDKCSFSQDMSLMY